MVRSPALSLAAALMLSAPAAHAGPQAPAQAESAAPASAARARPCKADAQRLCADVKPGQGRIAVCLKAHEASLSPTCAENLQARKAAVGVCKADREAHCAGIKGRRQVRACLLEHRAVLSPACASRVDKRPPPR